MNSYLKNINPTKGLTLYSAKEDYSLPRIYSINISEEKDIFSELPSEVFNNENKLMSRILCRFRELYLEYIKNINRALILPKLKTFKDEYGAFIIQLSSKWECGNASLYISFETNQKDSSYGFVWNDEKTKNF